jgi:hypothetical protein
MRVMKILHDLFETCRLLIDLRSLHTLFSSVEALTRCRKLTIAGLGRSLIRNCAVKHKIKAVDRLFGNIKIQKNLFCFYNQMLNKIIANNLRQIIIVDWSGLTPCGKFYFLEASAPMGGRALAILKTTFELKDYGTKSAHKKFLKKLKSMLPKNCRPIVLTDSGFKNPWFKLVLSLGWDYVGRIRGLTQYKNMDGSK